MNLLFVLSSQLLQEQLDVELEEVELLSLLEEDFGLATFWFFFDFFFFEGEVDFEDEEEEEEEDEEEEPEVSVTSS